MSLWSKNGAEPQELPESDIGMNEAGQLWTFQPIAGNPELLESLGWKIAPEKPSFDPIIQYAAWIGDNWQVLNYSNDVLEHRYEEFERAFNNQVNERLKTQFMGGYAPTHPAFNGQHLQARDDTDKLNFKIAQGEYKDAVDAGYGSVLGAEFRTQENNVVKTSFADGIAVLKAMTAWGFANTRNSWKLKDDYKASIRQRPRGPEPDIEQGWV